MNPRDWQPCRKRPSAGLARTVTGGILTDMEKLDIKALRQRVFSSLSEEEREEAGRILRAYLDVCARLYEHSKLKQLLDREDGTADSTTTEDSV